MHSGNKVKRQWRTFFSCSSDGPVLCLHWPNTRGSMSQGQYGLNAGLALQPDPGFTFVNLDLNYSADTLKTSNAVAIPVTGNYSFWMVENMFMYSPAHKVLGGQFTTLAIVNLANASVTADIPGTRLGVAGGGQGISDTWVQPFNLGWHLGRVDTWVGY